MKYAYIALALVLASGHVAQAQQQVDGYYRNNGTYVQPYTRSTPDSSYNNNYSVRGNTNPYTGQEGTRSPTYNDRTPQYNQQHYGTSGTVGGGYGGTSTFGGGHHR